MSDAHETDIANAYSDDVYGDRVNRGDGAYNAPPRSQGRSYYGEGRTHPNADDLAYVASYMQHVTPLTRCGFCGSYSHGPCERCNP